MSRRKVSAFLAISAVPVFTFVGCQQVVRIPVDFDLSGGAGTFDVVAGQTAQNRSTGGLGDSAVTVGSGTMRIKAENVSFTPAPAKGRVNYQSTGGTITVVASIAAEEDVAMVCETPVDTYGPYTITLDGDFNVTSISPDSIALTQETIDILNSGAFSYCLTVDSDMLSGTLTIDALSFLIGL